jgi:hypothetical protein
MLVLLAGKAFENFTGSSGDDSETPELRLHLAKKEVLHPCYWLPQPPGAVSTGG